MLAEPILVLQNSCSDNFCYSCRRCSSMGRPSATHGCCVAMRRAYLIQLGMLAEPILVLQNSCSDNFCELVLCASVRIVLIALRSSWRCGTGDCLRCLDNFAGAWLSPGVCLVQAALQCATRTPMWWVRQTALPQGGVCPGCAILLPEL